MSDPDRQIAVAKARENAQTEISDIDALAKSEPFNRYFVGKLNNLYRASVKDALTAKLPEDREKARHRANLLDELAKMPAQDRESAEKFLRTPPEMQDRPTQVG